MFDRIACTLRPALRPALRRLAAVGAAAALAAGGLLAPLTLQPAAADTTYPVTVTFDNVRFTMLNDGGDSDIEVFGTVAAWTASGTSSAAGGLAYRNFGKWDASPCEASWGAGYGMTCTKVLTVSTAYDFSKVFLCSASGQYACATGYSKPNNAIPLQVRPGERFTVYAHLKDYDALSANDTVCGGNLWFGPYTAAELQAKKFVADSQGQKIDMGFNGHAECWVAFHLS
jgi:hypothetical protein